MTPEAKIKKKLKAYLDSIGAYYFMPVQTGYGKQTLDILACIAWDEVSFREGAFTAFETKAPGNVPTKQQALIIAEIRKAGGEVYVVDYEVPPLRAAVTGNEAWYPAHAKEGAPVRSDQAPSGDCEH